MSERELSLVEKLMAYYEDLAGVSENAYHYEFVYDENFAAVYNQIDGDDFRKTVGDPKSFESREDLAIAVERAVLSFLKQRLESHPEFNRSFKDKTGWKVLDQLLAVVRLKELTKVRITQRGGRGKGLRFDVSEFAAAHFGKKILRGLDMSRRRALNRDELDQVRAACAKLKLTLPEVVEPTTTEKFFTEEENG